MKWFANIEPLSISLKKSGGEQLDVIRKTTLQTRYKGSVSAFNEISAYANQVSEEEQPLRVVWDLVQHKRRTEGTDVEGFDYDSGVLQTRQFMLASALRIRCHLPSFVTSSHELKRMLENQASSSAPTEKTAGLYSSLLCPVINDYQLSKLNLMSSSVVTVLPSNFS